MNSLQRWFIRRSARLEHYLFRSIVLLLALLLASQLIMLNPQARRFLSRVDSHEGEPYEGPAL